MGPVVILLKSPSDSEDGSDKYIEAFRREDFRPRYVPVLETAFVQVEQLTEIITLGPENRYGGVIMTSSRAAEAWQNAADAISDGVVIGAWTDTSFYVVGPKTAQVLAAGSALRPPCFPSESRIRGAQETGSGEKLAHFIVKDLEGPQGSALPLLYLTGDKNRDTLRTILTKAEITLHGQQVYETRPRESLAEDMKAVLEKVSGDQNGAGTASVWVVFFAPSSAQIALPSLQDHLQLPTSDPNYSRPERPGARFAAIGPTTHSYLTSEHPARFRVDAVAASPTPDGIVKAVKAAAASQ